MVRRLALDVCRALRRTRDVARRSMGCVDSVVVSLGVVGSAAVAAFIFEAWRSATLRAAIAVLVPIVIVVAVVVLIDSPTGEESQ